MIERLVGLLRIPYFWGCLVISAIVVFAPFVGAYIDTANLDLSLNALLLGPPTLGSVSSWFLNQVLTFLFYPLYMTKYMRNRVLKAEGELASILSTKDDFDNSFRGIAKTWPPLFIGLLIFVAFSIPGASTGGPYTGLAYGIIFFGGYIIGVIIFGSFIWVYTSALLGLYKIGKGQLNLIPPGKDPNMGVKPIGSLALSLAFSFFSVIGLGAISSIFSPFDLSGTVLFGAFSLVGIVMFFLPLYSIHGRMSAEKASAITAIRVDSFQSFEASDGRGRRTDTEVLGRIEKLLSAQAVERSVASARTWPFDTSVIGKLLAILLSVTAIILSGYLKNFLPGLH